MVTLKFSTAIKSLELVLAWEGSAGAGRHKREQKVGGVGDGNARNVLNIAGEQKICSILPESRFPRIRYCHRSPKPSDPADAAEKVSAHSGGTFETKFTIRCSTIIVIRPLHCL